MRDSPRSLLYCPEGDPEWDHIGQIEVFTISAVPEPSILALMLGGLGLLGLAAARRRA